MKKSDKQIKDLLAKIEAKRKELSVQKEESSKAYKTSCSLTGITENHVNLHTVRNVQVLAKVTGELMRNVNVVNEGYKLLGLPEASPLVQGYPVASWIHDLKLRASKLLYEEQRTKLASQEGLLKQLRSDDQKTLDILKDIEADLS